MSYVDNWEKIKERYPARWKQELVDRPLLFGEKPFLVEEPPARSPGKSHPLQCDFSTLISPEMFEKFLLPELEYSKQVAWPFYLSS